MSLSRCTAPRHAKTDRHCLTGHWENAAAAHGDKRRPEDLERWRKLAKLGDQTDRFILSEQAQDVESFKGKGDLEPIEQSWPTI